MEVLGNLGWTREQVMELSPGVRGDIKNTRFHAYWAM